LIEKREVGRGISLLFFFFFLVNSLCIPGCLSCFDFLFSSFCCEGRLYARHCYKIRAYSVRACVYAIEKKKARLMFVDSFSGLVLL
jgi:hypothetical protein